MHLLLSIGIFFLFLFLGLQTYLLSCALSTNTKNDSLKETRRTNIEENPGKFEIETEKFVFPILVFSCNRPGVRRCLEGLLKYRPDPEKFPIIVSQDCQDDATAQAIKSFLPQITYILQPDQSEPEAPYDKGQLKGYFKISRHYFRGLTYIFRKLNYSAVIIVEDDLDIAPDFYSYFSSTYNLLLKDPSLFCVSAWNDNGKENLIDVKGGKKMLYRSDFFPGLGWMMTRKLWDELEPKWPKIFWDDWLRDPKQRKGRSCIRPEISRTRTFGKIGVSGGEFYDDFLKFIKLNDNPVNFSQLNLSYLVKPAYDLQFVKTVYSSPLVTPQDVLKNENLPINKSTARMVYDGTHSFKNIAKLFGLMEDVRIDAPRTGYRGVVTFFYNSRRLYITPIGGSIDGNHPTLN